MVDVRYYSEGESFVSTLQSIAFPITLTVTSLYISMILARASLVSETPIFQVT